LKVPRKSHVKKDAKAAEEFRATMSERIAEVVGENLEKPVRIWVLDEHRYGLLPVIRRVWASKGVRVHAPYKTTYQWGYLHEARERVCTPTVLTKAPRTTSDSKPLGSRTKSTRKEIGPEL
jgi:hypothetical protein